MKLKFKKKQIKKDLPVVEKPYIYEDEKFSKLRRNLYIGGFAFISAVLVYCIYNEINFDLRHSTSNLFFLFVSVLFFTVYYVFISMVKEGTKWFWVTLSCFFPLALIGIYLDVTGYFRNSTIDDYYFLILGMALWSIPVYLFLQNIYTNYCEHKRNGIQRNTDELVQKDIQITKKAPKLKVSGNTGKKRKLFNRVSRSRNINPLKFTEPAVYGSIRANLTIWGLPIITVLLIE